MLHQLICLHGYFEQDEFVVCIYKLYYIYNSNFPFLLNMFIIHCERRHSTTLLDIHSMILSH